jgi:hypothetical protein
MDSAPAVIRNWLQLKNLNLSDVRKIIWDASKDNRMDVLEWLHEHTPGGVTAKDCRSADNYALRWAAMNGNVAVLE